MFFIRAGKLFAHLVFWLSLFQVVLGLGLVFSDNSPEQLEFASRRFFGGTDIGTEIDEAAVRVLYAVGAGMLAETAAAIHKMVSRHFPDQERD